MNLSLALALFTSTSVGLVRGCSRVFQNKYNTMIAGRSMDWGHSFEDILFINPRGKDMDGGTSGNNTATWTSKYGSVTASIIGYNNQKNCSDLDFYKDLDTDGVNEMGLGAHLLYLGEEDGTVYEQPSTSPDKKNIHYMRWVRYVLDNFATVAEAVEGMEKLAHTKANLCAEFTDDGQGLELGTHMAIEDATGDSAVFEHVNGTLQVYHSGTEALVMTNEPPFNQQRELLAEYEPWGGSIILPDNLPGSVASEDRFVRLEYYLSYTPDPDNEAEAVANVLSLISATNVPFGAPYNGGVYPTWWVSIVDVTNKVYYFNWLTTPNIMWVDLKEVGFDTIKDYYYLKPQDTKLVSNVMCDFVDDEGTSFPCKEDKGAGSIAFAASVNTLITTALMVFVLSTFM